MKCKYCEKSTGFFGGSVCNDCLATWHTFHYRDKVIITDGFYEGQEAIIITQNEWSGLSDGGEGYWGYGVQLSDEKRIVIRAKDLKHKEV